MNSAAASARQTQSFAILALISAAVLSGAYGFEYIGGLAPCQLCYYQRVPYFAAILICAMAWRFAAAGRWMAAALMVNFAIGAGLGVYHSGVEWQWWPGPASCTAMGGSGGTTEQLLAQILAAPVVRCDEIPWSAFGISLAGYNAIISAGLAAFAAHMAWNGTKDQNHGRI